MPAQQGVYEARNGWTPLMAVAIAGDAAFVLAGVLLPMPLVPRVPGIAFFGFAGVVCLVYVVSRKIAVRVDQSGVTLGGSPWRYRSTTGFFPWEDITKIVVWHVDWPFMLLGWTLFSVSIPYIGLQRRIGAAPISGDGSGRMDRQGRTAPVAGIAAGAARKLTACRLSTDRLAAAVAAYAPNVPIEGTTSTPKRRSRSSRLSGSYRNYALGRRSRS